MLAIGIVGFGYMGKTHYDIYQAMEGKVRVAGIVEPDAAKRSGNTSGAVGNLVGNARSVGFADIPMFDNLDAMLANAPLDVVDVTLPTFLHRDATLAAFAAGKHVICEKPLALDYETAREITAAADAAGKRLFVGHCIRFWPAYAKARDLVMGGEWGEVRTAAFTRLSALPGWMWQNWSRDPAKSGGAPLDLHIHDADFVTHLFGRPKGVSAFAGGRNGGDGLIDHIAAVYHYDDDRLVTAVGAWEYPAGYPFSMTFSLQMERGCLVLAASGELILYRDGAEPETIPVAAGDGWTHELGHFVECLSADRDSDVLSAADAAFSVKLVREEMRAAELGRRVDIHD